MPNRPKKKLKLQQTYHVVLRRNNGRFVKQWTKSSAYAAKKLRGELEEKYDDTYYVEVTH